MPIRVGPAKPAQPAAYETWRQDPTPENYQALLDHLKPTVDAALRSHAGGDESLRLRANIMTGQFLKKFDPKQAQLNTYLHGQLQGLRRYAQERQRVIHLPENRRADAQQVLKLQAEYRDRYGMDPSVSLVQDQLNMSRQRVLRAEGVSGERPASEMQSEKGEAPAASSRTPDEIWADYVYHDLDEVGKKIFEWTTGYNGRDTLSKTEIARRLKVTPAAVSSSISKILRRLDEGLELQ